MTARSCPFAVHFADLLGFPRRVRTVDLYEAIRLAAARYPNLSAEDALARTLVEAVEVAAAHEERRRAKAHDLKRAHRRKRCVQCRRRLWLRRFSDRVRRAERLRRRCRP